LEWAVKKLEQPVELPHEAAPMMAQPPPGWRGQGQAGAFPGYPGNSVHPAEGRGLQAPQGLPGRGWQDPGQQIPHYPGLPGPGVPHMQLGHQFSFDNENDILERERQKQASSCGCWRRCCQICTALVFSTSLMLFLMYTSLVNDSNLEIHGTVFTLWNYALPQFWYLLAGQRDTVSLTKWYKDLTDTDPLIGVGPGPNTRTYYGYQTVKRHLQGLALRIKLGTMERANELGMQILRDDMWPETGRTLFGFDNSDHATVRPYLADVLDGAEKPGESCDGSTCWNAAWLRHVFRQRFTGMASLSSDDLQWMITPVLHKVHLNVDLSDEEAKHFAAFQTDLMRVIAFPRNDLWETVLGEFPSDLRTQYINNYKAAVAAKWPDEDWSMVQVKAALLANAMLDSIALHAGPVVSGALEHLLALLYMQEEPGIALPRPLNKHDEAAIQDLLWETLRRYPPVAGVPYWAESDDETTWTHEIPNLQMALQDPSVFPDPLAFRLGRPGLNHANSSLSIGFADFALVDNDVSNRDSHACPGKRLALALLQAFLQEFSAFQWKADNAGIQLNSYSTSGFTLRKVG